MSCDFIFMLTREDRTVPDALARLPEVLAAGVRHIGFKDIGLGFSELENVAERIRAAGATSYLEVVSLGKQTEAASAEAAVALGVDYLLGGRNPRAVLPIIARSSIKYCPFAGYVEGHPSRLRGPVSAIIDDALELSSQADIYGLDLLAYRFDGDVSSLMRSVVEVIEKPVITAGSIDRFERIIEVIRSSASAFTVGTAALDGLFPARSAALEDQLRAIMEVTEGEIGAIGASQ